MANEKIAEEVIDQRLAPAGVGVKDQLGVGGLVPDHAAAGGKRPAQIRAGVHAAIGDDPGRSVERQGLALACRLPGRPEERVAKTDAAVDPRLLRVGPPRGHVLRHAPEQSSIHGCPVHIDNADDPAHGRPSFPPRPGIN